MPANWGRLVALQNKLRAEKRRAADRKAGATAVHRALQAEHAMRRDEGAFCGHDAASGPGGEDQRGRRADKDLTSVGIALAAFDPEGKAASGYGVDTVRRSKFLVSEALADEQGQRIARCVQTPSPSFRIIKRSLDETPFWHTDDRGEPVASKVLNQRCHIRWGEEHQSRAMIMMCELLGTDALGLMEGFERMLPQANVEALNRLASSPQRPKWPVHMLLTDALSANGLFFTIFASMTPGWYHIRQECDAHQAALCINKPFENINVVGRLYSFSKLMRFQTYRRRMIKATVRLALDEVDISYVAPSAESLRLLDTVFRLCISPIMRWLVEAEAVDILPAMAHLRSRIADHENLFKTMFNGMSRRRITHHCWLPGGGRCCVDDADAKTKMRLVLEYLYLPLVLIGGDPTLVKWFSITARVRGALVGLIAHGLLPRAFAEEFAPDLLDAEEKREEDAENLQAQHHAGDARDFQLLKRERLRSVAEFFRSESLTSELMTATEATSVMQSFLFDLLKMDVARKGLGERRAQERQERARRRRHANPPTPVVGGADASTLSTARGLAGAAAPGDSGLLGVLDALERGEGVSEEAGEAT